MLILRESRGLIDFMEWGRKQILLYFWYLEYIHILTYSIQKELWEWSLVYAVDLLFYLFVFQIWIVSSSTLLCFSACSSRKSKKYLTAGGTTAPEHSTLRKKSSTNCCSVPWKGPQIMWDRAETQSAARNTRGTTICKESIAIQVFTVHFRLFPK